MCNLLLNIIAHSNYSIKFCDRQVFLSDMRMIQMILSTNNLISVDKSNEISI